MNFFGKLFDGLIHTVFGGHDGGGSQVPVLAPPPMPPMIPVPDTVPHNGPGNDAAFQTFMSALTASMSGKNAAVLTGGSSSSETIQFGNVHTMVGVNPDGSTYKYPGFNMFGQVQTFDSSSVAQDTNGGIHYDGSSSWSGYFYPDKVVDGEDVVVQHSYNHSNYDQFTLVGIGHPTPDIYDYGIKG